MKRTCELCSVAQAWPEADWACVQPNADGPYVLACPPCHKVLTPAPALDVPQEPRTAPVEGPVALGAFQEPTRCRWRENH